MKPILFVDFNGVQSYLPFWSSLLDPSHQLHSRLADIEELIFRRDPQLVREWMLGEYTSEDIHELIERELGIPKSELFPIFEQDCRNIDIHPEIQTALRTLKSRYYLILATGNMDSFDRFTIPAHPELEETFDEIHNSYNIGIHKPDQNGKYFTDVMTKQGVEPSICHLIDDSGSSCAAFRQAGGVAHQTKIPEEVLAVIASL